MIYSICKWCLQPSCVSGLLDWPELIKSKAHGTGPLCLFTLLHRSWCPGDGVTCPAVPGSYYRSFLSILCVFVGSLKIRRLTGNWNLDELWCIESVFEFKIFQLLGYKATFVSNVTKNVWKMLPSTDKNIYFYNLPCLFLFYDWVGEGGVPESACERRQQWACRPL